MDKKIISFGAFFGILAIILGAFGAHALKKAMNLQELNTFETGVKYQMYHALFLLFIGMNSYISIKTKRIIALLTFFGVLFFSGSIYLLSTMSITGVNFKPIGFITPIGGLLLILAWSVLFIKMLNKKS